MDETNIEILAARIFNQNVRNGFWDQGQKRNRAEMIALIHSELSECLEAVRQKEPQPDQHCPEFSNEVIELADVVIRVLDYAQMFGHFHDVSRNGCTLNGESGSSQAQLCAHVILASFGQLCR